MEVIVRAESVELAQAGDRCDFIGTLIVVPDVAVLNLPGARAESAAKYKGVCGLKFKLITSFESECNTKI